MALGYEGYVQLGTEYVLGTGTSVPRARSRLESASGYGGQLKTPISEIGIGTPRTYDWEVWDGSLNFEVTNTLFALLKSWILARDTTKQVHFSVRKGSVQTYPTAYWNSISISANEGDLVDGSLGFVEPYTRTYDYGETGLDGFIDNKTGNGLLCPLATGMPAPLNHGHNVAPVPAWNTKITLDGAVYDFLTWTLEFSQDVTQFFSCNAQVNPQAPMFIGLGPMTVTFGGSWMWVEKTKPTTFPLDDIATAIVSVADQHMDLAKLELNTISDDVQGADSTTPVNVEYAVYELVSP